MVRAMAWGMSKRILATVEVDGTEITIVDRDGSARVEAEGVDVGPARGEKRLSGPQLCNSAAQNKAIYATLSKAVCLARFAARAS